MVFWCDSMLMKAAGVPAPNVSDVFSSSVYTGNGSTQSIVNNVNLSGFGGIVWGKVRSIAYNHELAATDIGLDRYLVPNLANIEGGGSDLSAFNADGFSVENAGTGGFNQNTRTYVAWAFRKAARFFSTVAWTGNGVAGRVIPHSLTVEPSLVIVKRRTGSASAWIVRHRSASGELILNTTAAQTGSHGNITAADASGMTLSADSTVNANFATYLALMLAHDPDGIVQGASFVTDGAGDGSINHGWPEGAQFVILKCLTTTADWEIYDTARSPSWATDSRLRANLTNAQDTVTRLSEAGTTLSFSGLSASQTYAAILIRDAS